MFIHLIILSYHLAHSSIPSVFDAKRLIGRKYDDAEVQADIKHFPFKVLNKGGKPYMRVQYRGEDKEFVSSNIPPKRRYVEPMFLYIVA
jgi:Hsp70 protein